MLIRIMYENRKYDMVKDYYLKNLIESGRISRFCRSDGWVEVGQDPVREDTTRTGAYRGPERRRQLKPRPLELSIRIGNRYYQPDFSGQRTSR